MTGYAVSSRIHRVEIGSPRGYGQLDGRSPDPPSGGVCVAGALEEIEGNAPWSRLMDLRDDIVTTWRQTTFYLFDPQSWR